MSRKHWKVQTSFQWSIWSITTEFIRQHDYHGYHEDERFQRRPGCEERAKLYMAWLETFCKDWGLPAKRERMICEQCPSDNFPLSSSFRLSWLLTKREWWLTLNWDYSSCQGHQPLVAGIRTRSHSGASCKTEGRAAAYSTHLELSTDSIPDQNWREKPRVPPSLCKRLGTCHREWVFCDFSVIERSDGWRCTWSLGQAREPDKCVYDLYIYIHLYMYI